MPQADGIFDCFIRGAGSAGCVLANRLPTDPKAAPDIRPNCLSTKEDRRIAVDSLKWAPFGASTDETAGPVPEGIR